MGSMICPRSGLFLGCCALRKEQESEDFHGLISFQLVNVSSKQECCSGVSALDPHRGGDHACQREEPLGPAVPPPSPPTRHAPTPQGPPCCYLLAVHLDAHAWPCCPNQSKTESSISLFVLAREPHDFSVILKTS